MTITAPPRIDTVPSSLTDDGLEEAFELELPCESTHAFEFGGEPNTDHYNCTLTATWRSVLRCGHSINICEARRNYFRFSPFVYANTTCSRCSGTHPTASIRFEAI